MEVPGFVAIELLPTVCQEDGRESDGESNAVEKQELIVLLPFDVRDEVK